jgi:aldehyde dehydrogenase (NAD+)
MSSRTDARIFVGGTFVNAHSRGHTDLVNPATEEQFARVADCDETDVGSAVEAAVAALPIWRETPAGERADILTAVATGIQARAAEMDGLVTQENGATRSWARTVGSGASFLYQAASQVAADYQREEHRESTAGRSVWINDPIGVVAAIVPWNSPQVLIASKLGPALGAGCPVVLKPSPETSLDALLLAEIFNEAGLPPGVLNVITGGRDTGAALVRHPDVRKVSFTGSTAAGRLIASVCGEQLKRVSAELGGKSAAVLLEDVELTTFQAQLFTEVLPFSGQVCYAHTRILVHRSRFEETLDCLRGDLGEASVGDPTDPATMFGPLVTAVQRERVEAYIASGLSEGARLVYGGGRPAGLRKGFYVEPTIFMDVKPEMRIFQEEIFGPVLVVVPFSDDDEAVLLANDSRYGLSGSVFGTDVAHATDVARRIESGRIHVNGSRGASRYSSLYKSSGLGSVGDMAHAPYLQPRNIAVPN